LAEEYEQEVVFIGVSNNDSVAAGKDYVSEFDVPYAMAHAPHVWEAYDVPYQPVTVVIDARGSIVGRIDGPVTYEDLKDLIEGAT
jgi:hypothetical protein